MPLYTMLYFRYHLFIFSNLLLPVFLSNLLTSYIHIDKVFITLGAFLTLSKPIGLIFGSAFWNISQIVSYERNIRMYMIVSGWSIFLIFGTNQATAQLVIPYPPFGLATVTVLNIAAYLMLLGIYNSVILVSANTNLRKTIRKHAYTHCNKRS